MIKRKAVLLIDDSDESKQATNLVKNSSIEYVEYNIKKFEQTCCADLPTTKAPSIFAIEGVFRGLEGIKQYIQLRGSASVEVQSEYLDPKRFAIKVEKWFD